MTTRYVLLNISKPTDKTYEIEDVLNEMAEEDWEVVGYSAHGWRGVIQPGFSHLILLKQSTETLPKRR